MATPAQKALPFAVPADEPDEDEPEAPRPRAAARRRRAARDASATSGEVRGNYTLPPITILDEAKGGGPVDNDRLLEKGRILQAKCSEFGVMGTVKEIHPGPVVTTYEFKPDAGVKYSKIVGLADDLALALEAESIRVDRISGKGNVGIEIPNEARETIYLREILESDTFRRSSGRLALGLGKAVNGDVWTTDLAAMPHLLIAGSTGTGKSVGLNCMIASILFRSTPDEVKLILIDPKRLELGVYEDIPHLLTPVVTDPKIASNVLKWAVGEMERRIRMLASEGVRNIEQFNNIIRAEKGARNDESGEELKPLHYVVIVIDELADLMMISSHEVEESITRLAQMARAVGIHLILATQRPSVDVITGLIKANFPSRISFRVAARVDSRTILDSIGAEQLLGRGDMLFLPPGSARLIRIHGAYVTEHEIARLTSFLRKQGQPAFDDTVGKPEKAAEAAEVTDRDELFDEAVRLVVQSGQASTSMLQRRFRVGFSRAGRLIDMMERDGIIGPADGSKPREILVAKDYYETVDVLAQVSLPARRRRAALAALAAPRVSRGWAGQPRAGGRRPPRGLGSGAARRRALQGGPGRRVRPPRLPAPRREAVRVGGGRPALPQGRGPLPPQRLLRQRPARRREPLPRDGAALPLAPLPRGRGRAPTGCSWRSTPRAASATTRSGRRSRSPARPATAGGWPIPPGRTSTPTPRASGRRR